MANLLARSQAAHPHFFQYIRLAAAALGCSLALLNPAFGQSMGGANDPLTGQVQEGHLATGGPANGNTGSGEQRNQGQPPLLIYKQTAVSQVTKGWLQEPENTNVNVQVPAAGGGTTTLQMVQNPTGSAVQRNQSSISQPQTILVQLPTCTGGQTLIGTSCACATGTWNGTSCVTTTPACNSGVADGSGLACSTVLGAGFTGTAYAQNYTTYTGGGACTTTPTGGYDTSGCAAPVTPSCNTGATDGAGTACSAILGAGYTGTAYTKTFMSYTGGGSCTPAPDGWDTSGCSAPATPSCNTGLTNGTAMTCVGVLGAGYSGTAYATSYTTYSGGGSCTPTAGATNTSGCSTTTPTCNSGLTNGASMACSSVLGAGYSGTAYATSYTTYTGGGSCTAAAGATNTSGCMALTVCVPPSPTTTTTPCQVGYTGGYTNTTSYTCPSTYGTPVAATIQTGSCTIGIPACVPPQILNAAGTACVTPTCSSSVGSISANSTAYGWGPSNPLHCNGGLYPAGVQYMFSCPASGGSATQTYVGACGGCGGACIGTEF